MIDSASIYSLDISMQKNYDKKIVSNKDMDHLIKECEQIIKTNNKEKDILHIIKTNIVFDDKTVDNIENISQEVYKAIIEIKFILVDKKVSEDFKKFLLKNIYS